MNFAEELENLLNKYDFDTVTNIPDYLLVRHIERNLDSLKWIIHDAMERGFIKSEYKPDKNDSLINAAKEAYAAWMGGSMNDVRETMTKLGHKLRENGLI